jgi:hypothetical protein
MKSVSGGRHGRFFYFQQKGSFIGLYNKRRLIRPILLIFPQICAIILEKEGQTA